MSTLILVLMAAAPPGQSASPPQLVEALHTAFGTHHARAVHAKGLMLEGTFTPDAQAASLTQAFHLQKARSAVVARFSDFTGIPDLPDTADVANPRGLALKFTAPDGTSTDLVTHSFDGFPTPTSDQFRELLLAIGASGPAAAKPTALDQFLASHPIAKTFLTTQKTPQSYGTIGYFGVNAFTFTNRAGASAVVRYQLVPLDGEQLMTKEALAKAGPNYLQDELKARVAKRPVRFQLFAQVAEPSDAVTDPSVAWPSSRRRVPLGTVELTKLADNSAAQDKALLFMPNNLPKGIEPADPMVNFRSGAYPVSFKERQ